MGKTKTRDLSPGSIRAHIVPDSLNEDKRTVELLWSTGAPVLRGFFSPFFEELSMKPSHVRMERLKSGSAPLLNSHRSGDISDVIGVVEKASISKGEGRATVRFSSDPDAEAIFAKVREGIVRNVSVGYQTFRLEQVKPQDASDDQEVPTFRAVDWEPHELSMVPVGAEAGATVRNEAPQTRCEFIELADQETRAMEPDNAPAAIPAATTPVAASAPVVPAPVTAEATRAIQVAERERSADILRVGRHLGVDEKVITKHIEAGTTKEAFRDFAFDDNEARAKVVIPDDARPGIEVGEDAKDKQARGMSNWLIVRSSNSELILDAAKRSGNTVDLDPGEFKGMTLLDMCRASLKANGQPHTGLSKLDLAGRALSYRSGVGGYQGIADFPIILENTLHKLLLGAYDTTPDTWSRFCHTGSVGDFRAHNRYRLGSFGSLDTVAEGGEFKNRVIPDAEKESISIETKGNIIMLTRQAIINDDMDAFSRLAAQFGRTARLSIETSVYASLALNAGLGPLLNDGNPIFDALHSNIGAGVALSVAGVDADRVLMKTQTDQSGNEILDLTPSVLLVSAGLGALARQVNTAEFDLTDVGGFAPNTSRGLYKEIVDTGRLTGTRRYTFADPAIAPVLEVAFLDGQQEPFLEMQEGFRVDGTEWKIRLDYGVSGIDSRGAVTDAGV